MGRAPCCDKANVKKGPWSPEEDAKLKAYIEEHGTGGNWIALPQKIGLKRCGKSCRLRWLNYLRPNIKHGGFSEEEDNIICSLYINIGSRWSIIAAQLPGRTDNDIKNYWNTRLKKKLMGKQQALARRIHSLKQEPPPAAAKKDDEKNNYNFNIFPSSSIINNNQITSYFPVEMENSDGQEFRDLLLQMGMGGRFSESHSQSATATATASASATCTATFQQFNNPCDEISVSQTQDHHHHQFYQTSNLIQFQEMQFDHHVNSLQGGPTPTPTLLHGCSTADEFCGDSLQNLDGWEGFYGIENSVNGSSNSAESSSFHGEMMNSILYPSLISEFEAFQHHHQNVVFDESRQRHYCLQPQQYA